MKIFAVTKYNRFTGSKETTYYANEAKAEAEVNAIKSIYAEAEAKGVGGHWGKVIYEKYVSVKEIEVIE